MAAEGRDPAVPDAVAPPPRNPRFPLVDGMRAIAVLAVVMLHVATNIGLDDSFGSRLAAHLNLGVTIFFLISGFLLYRPFIAHRSGGASPPKFSDYARRRLLRIFPAYWLVLTVVILLPSVTATSDGRYFEQYALIFSLSSSGGWTCSGCVLSQTWSLVVEATFYAALPLYVVLADRLARERQERQKPWLPAELLLLAGLAIASIVLHFFLYAGAPPSIIGGSLLSYGLWFALGIGLALTTVAVDTDERSWLDRMPVGAGTMWLLAAAAYISVALLLPPSPIIIAADDQLIGFVGLALVAFLLLVPATSRSGSAGIPGKVLSWRPVEWFGLVSYGVFLWHILVIDRLATLSDSWTFPTLLIATLGISLLIAAASYYLVERPLLRFKR